MPPTALNQRTALYNGAESVAAFADPVSELRALTSGSGVFELAWRAKIPVSGKDRVRWLNGMVTNTIKDLPPNHGNYNFLLNPQGRILGDMYIYNMGEYFLLDTDRLQLETIRNTLKRFIIMDKVELGDSNLSTIGICGPKSEEIMATTGIDGKGMQPLELRDLVVDNVRIIVIRGPEQRPAWHEIWTEGANTRTLWDKLIVADAQPVGTEALEWWRIIHGLPNYSQDIRERDLPQETEQAQALNFTKGCYIGQEIVERIRSRGQVHRKFTGFEFEGVLPQPGKFEENGRLLAEITSVAEVGGRKIGLGYVRRETGMSGAKLDLGGITTTLIDLPFQI